MLNFISRIRWGKKMYTITAYPNERIENIACKIHLKVEQLLKPSHLLLLSSFTNWEFLILFLVLKIERLPLFLLFAPKMKQNVFLMECLNFFFPCNKTKTN